MLQALAARKTPEEKRHEEMRLDLAAILDALKTLRKGGTVLPG